MHSAPLCFLAYTARLPLSLLPIPLPTDTQWSCASFCLLLTRGLDARYSGANPPLAHCVAYLCGGAATTLRRASASAYICANGKWRTGEQAKRRAANAAAEKDVGSVI